MKSDKQYDIARLMFVNTMNLNQSSKHLPFIVQEALKLYTGFKPGQKVHFTKTYQEVFFDIISKIIFGVNVFTKSREVNYTNPFFKS